VIKRFIGLLKTNKTALVYAALAVILLIGLYYRVMFAYNIEYTNAYMGTQYTHDEYNYLNMIERLLAGRGYGYWADQDAFVTPGYPLFMAAIMAIFGTGANGILAVKLVQAVLSAATVVPVFFICVKLLKNRGAALFAAALVSFYPPLILWSRYLLTETLYIFFLMLYFLVQLHAMEKKGRACNIAAGALFALSVLVRPMIVVLLPLPYIYLFILNKNREERRLLIKCFVFFVSAFVLVMLPWWIRNLVVLNQFIPLGTQSNPFYAGIVRDHNTLPASDNQFADGVRLLFSELWHRPFETIKWFTIGKLDTIFSTPSYALPAGVSYLSSIARPMHMYFVALGSVGILGGLLVKKMRMISIYMLFYIVLSLLFIPTRRFGLQYMPLLAIFSSFVLVNLYAGCSKPNDGAGQDVRLQ